MARSPLAQAAVDWLEPRYWNSVHLIRALEWLEQIRPDAPEAVHLATVLHDVERAFPSPDAPVFDASKGVDDPEYNRVHGARSAEFAGSLLREYGADPALIEATQELIRVHEDGGWPEADLVQAVDSLSFLETNVDLLLSWLPTRKHGVGPEEAIAKLRYMRDRIRIAEIRALAVPLCEAAERRIRAYESAQKATPGSQRAI